MKSPAPCGSSVRVCGGCTAVPMPSERKASRMTSIAATRPDRRATSAAARMFGPIVEVMISVGRCRSCLVHSVAAGYGPVDLDIQDLAWVHVMRVLGEHDKVREFAGSNRAFDRLLTRVVGAVPGVDSQRFIHGNALIGAPGFSAPTRAGDHALNSHQGSERSRAEIRARRNMHPRIEERPEGHASLHQLGTVEVEFIGVVVS